MDEIEQDIERKVALMSPEQREELKELIYALVNCYAADSKKEAILIFGVGGVIDSATTINCGSMSASNMLQCVNEFFGYLNTKDAPPKEMFN